MKKYLFCFSIVFLSVSCGRENKDFDQNIEKSTQEEKEEIKPAFSDGNINRFEIGVYLLELPKTSKVYSSSELDFTNLSVEDELNGDFGIYFGFSPSYPYPLSDYLKHPMRSPESYADEFEVIDDIYSENILTSVWDSINGEFVATNKNDSMTCEFSRKDNYSLWTRSPLGGINKGIDIAVEPSSDTVKAKLHI